MKFLYSGGGDSSMYGVITAPNHKGIPEGVKAGLPWAADVGCLEGPGYVKRADFNLVIKWLNGMTTYKKTCIFVAGFDIVGNALSSLEAYEEFGNYFTSFGWPWAYVAQNGAEDLPIPTDCCAVFIGGDTNWKESAQAVSVIKRAQAMGKHIHIGRVNWGRRYKIFRVLAGSENFTCDGTRQRFDGAEKTIKAWKLLEAQPPLVQL